DLLDRGPGGVRPLHRRARHWRRSPFHPSLAPRGGGKGLSPLRCPERRQGRLPDVRGNGAGPLPRAPYQKPPRRARLGTRSTCSCGTAMHPDVDEIERLTDAYFNRSKAVVGRFGDTGATYAVFLRRPVVSAPRLAIEWLQAVAERRQTKFEIALNYPEGKWVGAGEPLFYLSGPLYHLVDLETIYLQKVGPACVAAYNAFTMCSDLPNVAFLAMDARHCAGSEMAEMMAYAASVGSARARRKVGAKGFIGNATDATAHYFGQPKGLGTMPHALIGYAGSTVAAAEMFHAAHPGAALTVLVDYFGKEVTDSLAVCRRFPELAAKGELAMRLDTSGGRFIEELGPQESYAVLERNAPDAIRGFRTDTELRYLIGTGVSAA